jgi:N-acetylglucosaminyldiphosphoundecaprenol N-acetyl-beta-D-mannosaminyltransferase
MPVSGQQLKRRVISRMVLERPGSYSAASSFTIAGVRIDNRAFGDVVATIVEHAASGRAAGYVVTPNAHHVVLFQKDARLREIYEGAFLSVPDGVPLLWAARLLGEKPRGRVNGTDLFEALCAEAAGRGLRVYLLGGREGAAPAAARRLQERHPALEICGTYAPPFGFENDPVEAARILERINAARPDLLFVGLGAPKQEYWMHANRARLNVPVSLGIGVSFEFVGGVVRRAPVWMQKTGLEWLFRLVAEPQRLWKRYLVGNSEFFVLVVRQVWRRLAGTSPN